MPKGIPASATSIAINHHPAHMWIPDLPLLSSPALKGFTLAARAAGWSPLRFTLDIRSWDDDLIRRAWEEVKKDLQKVGKRRNCPIRLEEIWRVGHAPFAPHLIQMVRDAGRQLGMESFPMVSGAGHDASYMNQIASTAMIFVPSIGGRSHTEAENTSWEDCEAGANVLLKCMIRSANE